MNGKSKCKILKDIRRQIAQENDIAYVTSECKFQGNCSGTCPKCEAEVRYLEEELRKRQQLGKNVAVAGIAAALVIASSGCIPVQTGGDPLPNSTLPIESILQGNLFPDDDITAGVPAETTLPDEPLMGEPLPPTDMGEIPEDYTDPTAPTGDEAMGKVP